jgi:hypothetical protein
VSRLVAELTRFELAWHRREFLTWLAAAVFLALTVAWAGGGAIELVSGRGGVPRHAAWAVAHATAGVVAFGQLITTLVAATAVLRDRALRTDGLLAATHLDAATYLAGRFLGTTAVLTLVYSAVPLGLVAGFAVAGEAMPIAAVARATAVLAVPDVLVVASLCFAVGVRAPAFLPILVHGVALVALWQGGVALAEGPATRVAGALLDPFGNGALIAATAGWDPAARATAPAPLSHPLLVLNRALWLAVAAGALVTARRGWRWGAEPPALRDDPPGDRRLRRVVARGPAWVAHARLALAWIVRDRGVIALAALTTLNAVAAAFRLGSAPPDALTPHVRLFAILTATVYAGELVWRDRDARADGVLDALPWATRDRVVGSAAALGAVLVALTALAWPAAAVVAGPTAAAAWTTDRATAALVIGAVSLAAHSLVQHKVVAHLALVAAWVLASAVGDAAVTDPVPATQAGRGAVIVAALAVAGATWWRGTDRALRSGASR